MKVAKVTVSKLLLADFSQWLFGVYVRGGDDNLLACNKSFLMSVYLSKPQMNRCLLILNILVWHMEAKFGRSDAELHLNHPTNGGDALPQDRGNFI